MPPYVPEEVDVFSVPHSRMKELVNNYFAMVQSTNFTNIMDLQQLLESLSQTFREFKTHEQIENRFIMKRLKHKLKKLSIQNSAVCNCHKDHAVTDMMRLLQDGYKKKTDQDRLNYGLKLKKALEDFTNNFLPHMKEEEEVFQPLLLQYFSYEELCELKLKVIEQHVEQELEKTGWMRSTHTKEAEAATSSSSESETEEVKFQRELLWTCEFTKELKRRHEAELASRTPIETLPPEVMLKIFQYLQPRELCQVLQVNHRFGKLAMDPTLWKAILPTQWAKGDWSFSNHTNEDDEESTIPDEDEYFTLDDDADIDESLDSDYSRMIQQVRKEARILTGLTNHVLPKVGTSVQMLVLANCRTLTNGMLQRLLSLCPNVEHLDVSQTRITDAGLKRLGKNGCGSKLKFVNLSGCVNITDATLVRLAVALGDISSIHGNRAEPCPVECSNECETTENECLCDRYHEVYHKDPSEGCPSMFCGSNTAGGCRESDDGAPVDCGCSRSGDGAAFCNECNRKRKASSCCSETVPHTADTNDICDCDEGCNTPCADFQDGGGGCVCGDAEQTDMSSSSLNDTEKPIEKQEIEENYDLHTGKSFDKSHSPKNRRSGETVNSTSAISPVISPARVSSMEQSIPVHCHSTCETSVPSEFGSLEDCTLPKNFLQGVLAKPCTVHYEVPSEPRLNCCKKNVRRNHRKLEHLNLSGCYQVTDVGLRALAGSGVFSDLEFLDVSGCFHMSAEGLDHMVRVSPVLSVEQLYYCDNIMDGPFADTASGCRNLQCSSRVCCRSGD